MYVSVLSLTTYEQVQKWCSNDTQVCTLAKPGGCLYKVQWGTPQFSPPLGAQFLCWHKTHLLQGRVGQKLQGMKTPVC